MGAETNGDDQNCDAFFAVDNTTQLKAVAEFYDLPYPISSETEQLINENPSHISLFKVGDKDIVVGAVKYVDGSPALLKLYVYPKIHNDWRLWMSARMHVNGEVVEEGAYFTRLCGGKESSHTLSNFNGTLSGMTETRVVSESVSGIRQHYEFTRECADPLIGFKRVSEDGTTRFETHSSILEELFNFTGGNDFAEHHLFYSSSVFNFARGITNDDVTSAEVFFSVQSSDDLKAVADFYNLPVPVRDEETLNLLNQPHSPIRARHYNLFGSLIPICVGSIKFKNNQPSELRFYSFYRPWEFVKPIAINRSLLSRLD